MKANDEKVSQAWRIQSIEECLACCCCETACTAYCGSAATAIYNTSPATVLVASNADAWYRQVYSWCAQ